MSHAIIDHCDLQSIPFDPNDADLQYLATEMRARHQLRTGRPFLEIELSPEVSNEN